MPSTSLIEVKDLKLDLKNYRTLPQKNEPEAIKAMLAIKPERFHAIINSLIEDGYLPTENIIILNDNKDHIVKEGNRRIAALKMIIGIYPIEDFPELPRSIAKKITDISEEWIDNNSAVPCTVFSLAEKNKVDLVVALTHGKDQKASRDKWTSVATARHNRDENKANEPALDLLEKYLANGKNLQYHQKEIWSGDYKLTILDEAIRKLYKRMGYDSVSELVEKYPKIEKVKELENILLGVGTQIISFETVRSKKQDFGELYGIPAPIDEQEDIDNEEKPASTNNIEHPGVPAAASPQSGNNTNINSPTPVNSPNPVVETPTNNNVPNNNTNTSKKSPKALPIGDPRNIKKELRKFQPRGNNREKVASLRDEMKKLNINDTPMAFCFLLRSIFDISAKAYCIDHGLERVYKKSGYEKSLHDLLDQITKHLIGTPPNKEVERELHAAMSELSDKYGILSVTSMNQLIHNPKVVIKADDIPVLFSNIFPLLKAIN